MTHLSQWTLELVQYLYPELTEAEAQQELEEIRAMLTPSF